MASIDLMVEKTEQADVVYNGWESDDQLPIEYRGSEEESTDDVDSMSTVTIELVPQFKNGGELIKEVCDCTIR